MGAVTSFVGSLLGIGQSTSQTYTPTARDILPSTQATTPEAPLLGGSEDEPVQGKDSLKINLHKAASTTKTTYGTVNNDM